MKWTWGNFMGGFGSTLRDGIRSIAVACARVHEASPFAGRHTDVLPALSRLFSLAVSASALALIPSPHQLHCGIMIGSVSKEL